MLFPSLLVLPLSFASKQQQASSNTRFRNHPRPQEKSVSSQRKPKPIQKPRNSMIAIQFPKSKKFHHHRTKHFRNANTRVENKTAHIFPFFIFDSRQKTEKDSEEGKRKKNTTRQSSRTKRRRRVVAHSRCQCRARQPNQPSSGEDATVSVALGLATLFEIARPRAGVQIESRAPS